MIIRCYSFKNPEPPHLVIDTNAPENEEKCDLVPPLVLRMNNMLSNIKYEELKQDKAWFNQHI